MFACFDVYFKDFHWEIIHRLLTIRYLGQQMNWQLHVMMLRMWQMFQKRISPEVVLDKLSIDIIHVEITALECRIVWHFASKLDQGISSSLSPFLKAKITHSDPAKN